MKSIFYLTSVLLLHFSFAGCDNEVTTGPQKSIYGVIEGKVIDGIDSINVDGVTIKTEPATLSKTSDNLGRFRINDVNPGQYSLIAEKNGYYKNRINIYVYNNKTSTLDVPLYKIIKNNNYPEPPMLISPKLGEYIKPQSFIFKWSCKDIDGDNLTYDFYLGKSKNLLNAVITNMKASTIGNIRLENSDTYYWKVVVKDEHGAMNESELGSFVTSSY